MNSTSILMCCKVSLAKKINLDRMTKIGHQNFAMFDIHEKFYISGRWFLRTVIGWKDLEDIDSKMTFLIHWLGWQGCIGNLAECRMCTFSFEYFSISRWIELDWINWNKSNLETSSLQFLRKNVVASYFSILIFFCTEMLFDYFSWGASYLVKLYLFKFILSSTFSIKSWALQSQKWFVIRYLFSTEIVRDEVNFK